MTELRNLHPHPLILVLSNWTLVSARKEEDTEAIDFLNFPGANCDDIDIRYFFFAFHHDCSSGWPGQNAELWQCHHNRIFS